MQPQLREQYTHLVEYLGLVLGPSYEIALYDLDAEAPGIIAIANGFITGRGVGAPLAQAEMALIQKGYWRNAAHWVNYSAPGPNNKTLRASALFIVEGDTLAGLLGISFDDTAFRKVSREVLSLCHPDEMLHASSFERLEHEDEPQRDLMGRDVEGVIAYALRQVAGDEGVDARQIRTANRLQIIRILKEKGVFLLKGTVPRVARLFSCSTATVYRYLSQTEQ